MAPPRASGRCCARSAQRRRACARAPWSRLAPLLAACCALGLAACAAGARVHLPPLHNPLVPQPPSPPPPLAVQEADAAAYEHWAKRDQYRYSAVPLKVEPAYGTDWARGKGTYFNGRGGTTFYSNMPVAWTITQVGGGRHARYAVLVNTNTHLQLAGAGTRGVWRITAAAISCLDTCTVPNCPADSCTMQKGSPACSAVAAGYQRPGKGCDLAYTVVHFRIITRPQIVMLSMLFCAFVVAVYICLVGGDAGAPGLWWSSDGTSWTYRPPKRPAPVAPPPLVTRAVAEAQGVGGAQRLRLDIDDDSNAALRPAARMYRNAQDQEKTLLL